MSKKRGAGKRVYVKVYEVHEGCDVLLVIAENAGGACRKYEELVREDMKARGEEIPKDFEVNPTAVRFLGEAR